MSFDVSVVQVTEENKDALVSIVTNMYEAEGCGICEKQGAEVFWFSSYSRAAHAKCFKVITCVESNLVQTINSLFQNVDGYDQQNSAHIKAIKAVKVACGPETLLSYLVKNGVQALTNLFDTVGVQAAKEYALGL